MLIFYEGRPGSGKSLSAVKEYIVPMLAKGREVYAYVEGLNVEKLAQLAGIDLDRAQLLLKPLTREQVSQFYNHVTNDAFVVIDEIQNFFPKGRKALDQDTANFFAEYRHRGLDILLMGQVFSDVHTFILNRCSDRVLFTKRDAIGKPDEFNQTVYKPVIKGDKTAWQEIRKIKGEKYDNRFFGAYKSHTDETDNKETLTDARANVWNNPILRKWLPLYGLVFVSALVFIAYMFFGGGLENSIIAKPTKPTQPQPQTKSIADFKAQFEKDEVKPEFHPKTQPPPSTPQPQSPDDLRIQAVDEVVELNKSGRIRLSGYIKMGKRIDGIIEWRGNDEKVIQRLNFDQLKVMGYLVLVDANGTIALVTNGINRFTATSWPIQDFDGKITQARQDKIASNTSM